MSIRQGTVTMVLSLIMFAFGMLLGKEMNNSVKVAPKHNTFEMFQINGGTFDRDIDVIISEDTSKVAQWARANIDSTIVGSDFNVRGIVISNEDFTKELMYLPSDTDIAVNNHELFHVLRNTMLWANVPLCDSSEEAWSYEMQYLSKQFYDHINKRK